MRRDGQRDDAAGGALRYHAKGMSALLPLTFRATSESVCLRAPRLRDARELVAIRTRAWEFLRPWSPSPTPTDDPLREMRELIRREREDWQADRRYAFIVTPSERDVPVGRVVLSQVFRGVFQNAYLGYWIDGAHARRGWMTTAVRLALGVAFERLALHRVQAAIIPRNAPSLALARRVGLRHEGEAKRYLEIAGVWEDHAIFAITREEWPIAAPR